MKSTNQLAIVLFCFCAPAFASELAPLFGQWGTEKQCNRALLTPTGSKHAAPFDVRQDWLGHGDVWCRLIWSTSSPTSDGLFAVARGLCGEDMVRDYRINFELKGDELTLIWDIGYRNGPVKRCAS